MINNKEPAVGVKASARVCRFLKLLYSENKNCHAQDSVLLPVLKQQGLLSRTLRRGVDGTCGSGRKGFSD